MREDSAYAAVAGASFQSENEIEAQPFGQMKMKTPAAILSLVMPVLTGCWSVSDIAAYRDFDHSVPFGTEVRSGLISARTPAVHLIDEKNKTGIALRGVNIGVVAPERYTAFRMSLSAFVANLESEKKIASQFRSYEVVLKGAPHTVYLLRFDQKNTVKLVYMVFIGNTDEGASITNTSHYFDTAFKGGSWWDKPPEFSFGLSIRWKSKESRIFPFEINRADIGITEASA